MSDASGLMTAEELLAFPHGKVRTELLEGVLHMMEPGGGEQGRIAMTAGILLGVHVRTHGLGVAFGAETGFILARDPDTVRAPDAAFVAREREAVADTEGYIPGAPDLAIEVISPNDRRGEVEAKTAQWLACGTRLVLEVRPREGTVTAHRPGGDVRVHTGADVVDAGDVVDGWTFVAADVFA